MAQPTTAGCSAARQAGVIGLDEYLNELLGHDHLLSLGWRANAPSTSWSGLPFSALTVPEERPRVALETKYRPREEDGLRFAVYVPSSSSLTASTACARRTSRRRGLSSACSSASACTTSGTSRHRRAPPEEARSTASAASSAVVEDATGRLERPSRHNRALRRLAGAATAAHAAAKSPSRSAAKAGVLRIGAQQRNHGLSAARQRAQQPPSSWAPQGWPAMTTSTDRRRAAWHRWKSWQRPPRGPVIVEAGCLPRWLARRGGAGAARGRALEPRAPDRGARRRRGSARRPAPPAGPKPQEAHGTARAPSAPERLALILGADRVFEARSLFGRYQNSPSAAAAALRLRCRIRAGRVVRPFRVVLRAEGARDGERRLLRRRKEGHLIEAPGDHQPRLESTPLICCDAFLGQLLRSRSAREALPRAADRRSLGNEVWGRLLGEAARLVDASCERRGDALGPKFRETARTACLDSRLAKYRPETLCASPRCSIAVARLLLKFHTPLKSVDELWARRAAALIRQYGRGRVRLRRHGTVPRSLVDALPTGAAHRNHVRAVVTLESRFASSGRRPQQSACRK